MSARCKDLLAVGSAFLVAATLMTVALRTLVRYADECLRGTR